MNQLTAGTARKANCDYATWAKLVWRCCDSLGERRPEKGLPLMYEDGLTAKEAVDKIIDDNVSRGA